MTELRPIGTLEVIKNVGVYRLVGYNTDIAGKKSERFEKAEDVPTPTTCVAPPVTKARAVARQAAPAPRKQYKPRRRQWRPLRPTSQGQREMDKDNLKCWWAALLFFGGIGIVLVVIQGILAR